MYMDIGTRPYNLLQDIQTILRASTRPELVLIEDKFITIGMPNSVGKPHIAITPSDGEFANLANFKVRIFFVVTGWNKDYHEELLMETLRNEVIAELMDEDNRRTATGWLNVSRSFGRQNTDRNNRILTNNIELDYRWGGEYNP